MAVPLHPIAHFLRDTPQLPSAPPAYFYEGLCPHTRKLTRLPRTARAEAVAQGLMRELAAQPAPSEGKMYGVLLVRTPDGQEKVLQAFSGSLNGQADVPGWVPPIPGRDRVALEEAHTLQILADYKQDLIERFARFQESQAVLQAQQDKWAPQIQARQQYNKQRKKIRKQRRQELEATHQGKALDVALEALKEESRQDGFVLRDLKKQRQAVMTPLEASVRQQEGEIDRRKRERSQISRRLQTQMHAVYTMTNFAGDTKSLQELLPHGRIPTGTGDCCAPKLLHYAATHRWVALSLAEFWWGPSPPNEQKLAGTFYGACEERCAPIMGFLLSGLHRSLSTSPTTLDLDILYEDEALLVVDKPDGLLSVPGRYSYNQDSVLSRARLRDPAHHDTLVAAHRLDRLTSGLLVLAKTPEAHSALSHQFRERLIQKEYEALLDGHLTANAGEIHLPLAPLPNARPKQRVDHARGKASHTQYTVLATEGPYTRILFKPITGRTHQLRVHASDPQGLGTPILGDPLYHPKVDPAQRLHLHARYLRYQHPLTQEYQEFYSSCPF